jgi:hypothetical protein
VSARSLSESGGFVVPSVRRRSEAVDVDRGKLVERRLKNITVVVHLHEFTPTRAICFAHAIREVSCERGFA